MFVSQVSEAGVHRPHVGGIHGRSNDGSYSLVLAGGFEDEVVSLNSSPVDVLHVMMCCPDCCDGFRTGAMSSPTRAAVGVTCLETSESESTRLTRRSHT